jgi:hypothetical protein
VKLDYNPRRKRLIIDCSTVEELAFLADLLGAGLVNADAKHDVPAKTYRHILETANKLKGSS